MPSTPDPQVVPVVASLRRSFGAITLCACLGAAAWPVVAVLWHGISAIELAPYLPWSDLGYPRMPVELAVPCLVALPLFLMSAWHAQQGRTMRCSRWFVWGVFVIALVKVIPRGVLSPGWFLQPLLVVLTAVGFGVVPGLTMASLAALTLATCAYFQEFALAEFSTRSYAVPVIAILLGGGLLGSLLHKTMYGLLVLETEQRERIEQTLRALRQRERLLKHAMRIATIGEMTSMVVHQLRNKFQIVQGHVSLGLRAEATEKDQRLEQIRSAVQAASHVVEQLLNLAHPGEGAPRLVDLVGECRAFADSVRLILPSSIRLEVDFPLGSSWVTVVPEELADALLNLVINAKQAMRSGTITIRVATHGESEVAVTVADDGPGLPEHVRANLFTPFLTTKPKGQGTGLGLIAVDRFVRTNGGTIHVESEVGQGAAFHMVFPRTPAAPAARVG